MTKHGLLIGFFATLAFNLSFASTPKIDNSNSDYDYYCMGESIPAGSVFDASVKNEEFKTLCGEDLVLRVADSASAQAGMMFICVGSPMPGPTWVVTAMLSNMGCPTKYGYQIKDTVGEAMMFVCVGSPIPEGWAITATVNSQSMGYYCPTGYSYHISNSSPPPPPPLPGSPKAPIMQQIERTATGHIVRWSSAGDYPQYANRYALNRSENGGSWKEVYKGQGNGVMQWSAGNARVGVQYKYRIHRIVPFPTTRNYSYAVITQ